MTVKDDTIPYRFYLVSMWRTLPALNYHLMFQLNCNSPATIQSDRENVRFYQHYFQALSKAPLNHMANEVFSDSLTPQ